MSLADLQTVLRNVANPDNTVRAQAEQHLTTAKANPNWLLPALLEVSKSSDDAVVAHMSVILLRRFLSKTVDGLFDKLDQATQTQMKGQLLSRVAEAHPNPAIRKGIAHCVSGLGCQLLEVWPELLPALFSILHSEVVEAQCSVLMIFASLAPHFSDAALSTHAAALRDMCSFALQRPPIEVKTSAVEVTMELVTYLKSDQHIKAFQQLLPPLIAAVGQALAESNWMAAERSVQSFISLAEVAPEFFTAHLKDVFAPFLEISTAGGLDSNLRRLAFEFTITLAETDPKAVRRLPEHLPTCVPLAMQLQLEVQHSPSWGTTEEENDDEATDFDFGVEALDRLAVALGGKRMHPVVSPLIMQYIQNSDWRYRHAALWSLSQVAEGCAKEFKGLLDQIVPLITKGLEDPHERVRHAAITCLAQFSTEFAPEWQATYHSTCLPLLMQRMSDVPRVAALAAQACINFLEGAEKEHTEPYLDALLTTMLQLLQSTGHRFVSEAVVSAITAIASHAEGLFGKYYDTIVPWLKTVITAPVVPKADRMLRAKALECLSRIAMAVGKERFMADAPQVLEAMQRMQTAPLEADDPVASYLMRAWGRMAECLGADMGNYYGVIMPVVMAQVQTQTDIVITDEEGQDAEEGVQSLTLSLKGLGEKRISIKTSALEEKALAMAVLAQLLEAGNTVLFPFVESLVPVVVPLLKFVYMEEVRDDAATCMPALLKCVTQHDSSNTALATQLVQHIVPSLVEAIKAEVNSGVKGTQLQALSSCIEEGPANCLGSACVGDIVTLVQKVLADSSAAREKLRIEKRSCDDEEDGEKLDADIEAEEEVMCQALDVTTSLLKQESAFLPHWESTFFPQFSRLLNKGLFETRLALCASASFLEYHGSGACAPHVANIASALLDNCRPDHDDPDVVQVACYGLGVGCSQGAVAAAFVPTAVQRLLAVAQQRSKDAEWESAVCNAVGAMLKAMDGQPGAAGCGAEAILPVVVGAIPVKGDEKEAQLVHRRLLHLLEQGHPMLASQQGALLQAMQSVKETSFVDAETAAKLRGINA